MCDCATGFARLCLAPRRAVKYGTFRSKFGTALPSPPRAQAPATTSSVDALERLRLASFSNYSRVPSQPWPKTRRVLGTSPFWCSRVAIASAHLSQWLPRLAGLLKRPHLPFICSVPNATAKSASSTTSGPASQPPTCVRRIQAFILEQRLPIRPRSCQMASLSGRSKDAQWQKSSASNVP